MSDSKSLVIFKSICKGSQSLLQILHTRVHNFTSPLISLGSNPSLI